MFDSIDKAHKVGIFTHSRPDGDALGSSFAMMAFLEDCSKESYLFLPNKINSSLQFMIPDRFRDRIFVWSGRTASRMAMLAAECDLFICLDFNTISRIDKCAGLLAGSSAVKILVDHHVGPQVELFDRVYSRTDVSSTCELLYSILKESPRVNGDCSRMNMTVLESLMTGMTTDTNNFANSVYPNTFAMASDLLDCGVNRNEIIDKLYFRYPERRLKAEAFIMSELLNITRTGVAYFVISEDVTKRFGLQEGDTEGFVNVPLSLNKVKMSVCLREHSSDGKVRVSIRSKAGWSAREFAAGYFHGGGHELASGGTLYIGGDIKNIKSAEYYVRKSISDYFNKLKLQKNR